MGDFQILDRNVIWVMTETVVTDSIAMSAKAHFYFKLGLVIAMPLFYVG